MSLQNNTITQNHADADLLEATGFGDVTGSGGGIHESNRGALPDILDNTIIAENYVGSDTSVEDDVRGFVVQTTNGAYVFSNVRGSNNLIGVPPDSGLLEFLLGDATEFRNSYNGNQIGTIPVPLDPMLGPLADNGGPTFTHALLPGSPAIDKGNNALIPADILDLDHDSNTIEAVPNDQRISPSLQTNITVVSVAARLRPFLRIVNNTVDIGAFEYTPSPVANGGNEYAINEGESLALSGEGSSAPNGTILWYEVDYNYDGLAFKVDSSGASPRFSQTAPDGPFTQTVAVRVTDDFGQTAIATVPVTVRNVAPTATISGDNLGVPGLARSFLLSATDPSPADTSAGFTYKVDFGDGTTTVVSPGGGLHTDNGATVNGSDGPPAVSHTYLAPGTYVVTVTATDKDGGVSDPVSQTVQVVPAAVLPDPDNPGSQVLFVGGTMDDDHVQIVPGNSGEVKVLVNGKSQGDFPATSRIVIFGLDGDDNLNVANSIKTPVEMYGGAGNDTLNGGAGDDILLGEAGDDTILGGSGRDLMIGGTGRDRLIGNADDDILIGGFTDFDAESAALAAIMEEWGRTDLTYALRIDHLQTGGGFNSLDGGASFIKLNALTVHDDDAVDVFTGSAAQDWFFAQTDGANKDKLTDAGLLEFTMDM